MLTAYVARGGPSAEMNVAPNSTAEPDAISDRDLVLNFESIGDNCEFGLVQRKAGAEPLGLLRFSSAPVGLLVRALRARFDGLADPANVRLWEAKGEYLIWLAKYDFVYHTYVQVGEMDPEALHRQQTRTLPFLVQKLISDLENPEKILIFRQNEPLAANDLIDLQMALADYGPATLLWVQQARPGHQPGTVDRIEDRLMTGYVRRLASRENAPDLDLASWLVTLRRAHALWQPRPARSEAASPSTAAAPASIEIVFGAGGNAGGYTQFGWSPAEEKHTFATDERSLLTFAPPADAPEYRLEMDIAPFIAPPALPSQRLEVMVNGELVRTLDPVPSGVAVCTVPRRLLHGHDRVDILLIHPRATRPRDVDVSPDTRRLAVMFRRLRLTGVPVSAVPVPEEGRDDLFSPRPNARSDPGRPPDNRDDARIRPVSVVSSDPNHPSNGGDVRSPPDLAAPSDVTHPPEVGGVRLSPELAALLAPTHPPEDVGFRLPPQLAGPAESTHPSEDGGDVRLPPDPPDPSASTRPPEVEIVFGLRGPARSDAEYGWSPREADFAWTIDDRSLLILTPPADAPVYRLELDMVPFVRPPTLPSQRLEVMVNGTIVHTFDPVPFGVSACVVSGDLVRGHDKVEIQLTHPRAARPSELNAGDDTRRLAVMFRRLMLVGLPE